MEEKKITEEDISKLKRNNNKKNVVIIVLVFAIVLMITLVVFYYRNNKGTESNSNNENGNNNTIVVDKITSVSKITINDTDQVVKVDGKEFKIKKETSVDGSFLLINGEIVNTDNGGSIYADNAYVTNKFIIFTIIGQENESIVYAIDQNGNKIKVEDNKYQINDLKVVNDHLQASGHIFCGLDEDCKDVPLDIIYENNKITVTPKQ